MNAKAKCAESVRCLSNCDFGSGVYVRAASIFGDGVVIGAHTTLGENVVVGQGVQIGAHSCIDSNVMLGIGDVVDDYSSVERGPGGVNIMARAGPAHRYKWDQTKMLCVAVER